MPTTKELFGKFPHGVFMEVKETDVEICQKCKLPCGDTSVFDCPALNSKREHIEP